MNVISVGELLWDVFESGEHLGGAPFNFAAHAARLGHNVHFLSAVGDDERGRRALERMGVLGLSTRFVRVVQGHPTGTVTVKLGSDGVPAFRIHRPAAYDCLELSDDELAELSSQNPNWIYYGTLHQVSPAARRLTERLVAANPRARRFYDVNLRVDSYTPALVVELLGTADVVKLNEDEVLAVEQMLGEPHRPLEAFCRACAGRFGWRAVCVTRGPHGCAVRIRAEYLEAAGYPVTAVDTVGAGDAFAAAFLHGLGGGWAPARIADFANRVGALVAGREGAVPPWTVEECLALS